MLGHSPIQVDKISPRALDADHPTVIDDMTSDLDREVKIFHLQDDNTYVLADQFDFDYRVRPANERDRKDPFICKIPHDVAVSACYRLPPGRHALPRHWYPTGHMQYIALSNGNRLWCPEFAVVPLMRL